MTKNKRVTNKQLQNELEKLNKKLEEMNITIKLDESDLDTLAIKTISRMVKLKSMEDWFNHASKSDVAWSTAYKDLELTEEEEALGEAAKLMTLMNLFQEEEEYEKCAIIKSRMNEINRILKNKK